MRAEPGWQRRARPLLGTLVEVGADATAPAAALDAAFAAIAEVQACLSRFDPASDIGAFHALVAGDSIVLRATSVAVLAAARTLQDASDGVFDISLGSAPGGWRCDGARLHKLDPAVRLDLGGIAKGYAVDRAVEALIEHGCATGWVNAGGDLRVFGAVELPLQLRDEQNGGVRRFGMLGDGSFATSHFDAASRSRLCRGADRCVPAAHVSVAAPLCLWADALTKIVAASGDPAHPLLARHDARAWLH
jgi:thiamine biosynthesis lipoprotein